MTARHPCPGWPARVPRRRSALPWWPGARRAQTRRRRGPTRCWARTEATLIPVAGVDGPVAAGFAAGDLIPFAVSGGACLPGKGEASATDDSAGEGDFRDAYVRCSGLTVASTHRCGGSSLRRPRGQLSGSGWRGCPAGGVETTSASPQGTDIDSGSTCSVDRWVPRLRPKLFVVGWVPTGRSSARSGHSRPPD